ncbi:T9SS type B sorting domain-containing protein [Flavobacteriaceae bacterium]|nr:T9SS type B sorting domain-containing protein [Flavobacteriaceae bacterium]
MIRVLVADHQPIVSYGIRMLFENSTDIKIVNTASSAKQLLDYLKKSNTDIVLMSIDLADVNGDDLTGTLLTTLSAGEYISIDGSYFSTQSPNASNPGGNMYVWTSKTAFAYQGIGGANNEANQEMFFVPPINCRTPKTINNIPLIQKTGTGGVDFTGGISIVAEFGASILVNGAASTASPQAIDGNPNFVTYLISGLTGNVSISSNKQIYVSYYGANGVAALAGFYSGFIFKPEIRSSALTSEVTDICLPNIELDLSSLESFDSYQWFYNGLEISGANSETLIPEFAGFYQLAGVISNCDIVLSDNIPVSNCAGDFDTDGINNNIDSDNDNDGTLNSQESNCDLTFDLSSTSGQFFTASSSASLENNLSTPFIGTEDQSMWFQAAPATETTISSTSYGLNFDLPTSYIIKQSESGTFPGSSDFDDLESFILSVPFEETLTVYDPDNQLLIDTNYDGVYDNNIEEFTAFEIRFKINSAFLASEDVTFSFHSFQSTGFSLEYFNNSLTEINSVAFQLVQTCRLTDTDGDLIFDSLDLDSDNDGIFDVIENGNSSLDQDQNGQIDEVESNDINNDGRHDFAVNPVDFDGDSILDYLDLDSDNDGLYDLFEAGIGVDAQDIDNDGQIDLGFSDTNMNGASDVSEAITPIDSDANGIPDYIQLDSDSDGCFDSNEAGFTATLGTLDGIAFDNYGLITGGDGYDFAIDSNSDGLFDYQEYVNIIPLDISSPIIICEFDNTSISVSLDSDSSSFDSVQWEQSLDGGASWIDVAEDFNSFEGQNSSDLQILNASISISNTIFRSRLERIDYVCGPIYSNEVTIIVNTTPTANAVLDIAICDDDNDGVNSFDFIADVTPTVLGTQDPLGFSVTYHPTQEDADLNTNAYVIPYSNVLTQESVFVRIENVNNITCYDTTSFVIEVFDTPVIAAINDLQNCDDGTDGDLTNGQTETDLSALTAVVLGAQDTTLFNVSYHLDTTDANAGANALPLIYYNTTAFNQTLFVRIENTTNTNCYITEQFNIIVNTTPTANAVEDIAICDDDNDGVNSFDFIADVTPTVLGTQDPLGFSVTYHPTQEDADLNTNAYVIPYSNVLTQESVFVRIENVNNVTCYDTTSFVIEVFDTPVPPVDFEYYQCDYTNSGDLTEVFDLVALNADIINGQDLTITHYETEADAEAGTNPIVGLYTNTSPVQTIYVLLVSNILSDCTAVGSYTIGVDPLPNVIVDVPLVQCDIDDVQDGISIYNLEEVGENVIIGDDASNYSLTFHLSQADLDAGINAIPNPTSYVNLTPLQTIYTRVENIATTCYTTSFFFLETIFNPIPDDAGLIVCDNSEGNGNDYDGLGLFTLSDANDYILSLIVANPDNDITSPDQLTIAYYTSETNALLELDQLPNEYISEVADAQTLFLRVERDNDCFGINSMLLQVLPVPTYDEVPDEILCTYTPGFIEVDFVADYNPIILGSQAASEVIITYHTSQEDADTGVNALPNPYTVVEQITVFVREEVQNNDPLVTACFISNVSFTLTVEPRPEFVAPIPLIVCDDDDVLDGLTTIDISVQTETIMAGFEDNVVTYHVSEDDANAGENPLDLLYTTIVPDLQTIFVRIEDDMTAITGCYSITPYDLVVVRPPAATTPESYEYCDPDADGFGVFNLSSLDPEITGTLSNLVISYHETQSDAFNNINPIIGEYFNVVAYEQTIFVRIQDTTITTDCFSYVDFSIIVNDVPQIELTPDTLEVCDDDFDGFGLFDLSLANEQILNGLDPLEFEVTYYETPENAETATNPIATPFSYTNLNPTNHEVYVRVENIITGCYNAVPLPLLVNPLPTIVLPTPLAICDDLLADSFTAFDLTVKNTEITLGDGSLEVVYYTSLLDAESANNAILDPTSYTNQAIDGAAPNPQTLHVRVTDLDTGCYDLTTLTIRVLPNPTPSPDPVDLELCDETSSGDGLEVFDLTIDEVFILNGELGVSASYYQTLEDAEAGENAIATPQAYTNIETPAQLIYVRVTNDLTGCYTLVDFNIIVHPLPQANVVSDLIACELDTDDVFDFDLESQTDLILGGQDPSLFEVTYHTSLLDAETGLNFLGSPYTNISDPEVIFVSVVNTDTGCRNTQLQFNLEVHEAAQAFAPLEFYVLCDDNVETDGDPSNDSVEFDLSVQDAFVLDGQDPLNYTVSYYASQSDADQGINALPMLYQNTVNPQVIIARVDNDIEVLDDTGALVDSSICYATALLTLNVDPLPIVLIDMDYILCVDTNGTEVLSPLEIETGLSSEDYTFIWSDATGVVVGTGSSYAPSQGGTYSLEVFDATLQTQCAAPVEVFTVIESTPPILTAQVTTAAFASTHVIEALATGQGVYEYSLDQGPWGDSGVFVDVTPGEHVVTARDLNGCGETQVVVYVIDYPLYFTPNGDGYNDTWNIVGVANQNNAKILIFDRFGKLLKQISPSGEGWDGTYNGAQLPSSDYWFTLDYTDPTTGNPQVLRAHFALKR